MAKEIKLDELDCRVFQDFVTKMCLSFGKALKVTEFEVKGKNKLGIKQYEIEFETI